MTYSPNRTFRITTILCFLYIYNLHIDIEWEILKTIDLFFAPKFPEILGLFPALAFFVIMFGCSDDF